MKNPISKPLVDNGPRANLMASTRDLTPLFDPEVDKWLRFFADTEKLENCIANITSSDPAVLILSGPPATGKTLLAHGVSRLWSTAGPTQAEVSMRDLMRAIALCPLVVMDGNLGNIGRNRILRSPKLIVITNHDDLWATKKMLPKGIADRCCFVRSQIEAANFLLGVDTHRFVEGDAIARHALWLRENRHDKS